MSSELAASCALRWMQHLLGFALALQTAELLCVRRAFGEASVFRWSVIRREFSSLPRPARALLDGTLAERPFTALLSLQLAAAVALMFSLHGLLAPLLLLLSLLVCMRFRGTYNGGSDSMTVVLLLSLTLASGASAHLSSDLSSNTLAHAGLAYAAVQLTLSYFIAGLSKLREPSWRAGRALGELLAAPQYGARAQRFAAHLSASPKLATLAAWLVIGFECAFPLAWWSAPICLGLLAMALAFHLLNAFVLGLNRFVWVWLAAYPALLYWSQHLRR